MTRRETPKMFGTDTILGADHSIAVGALTMAKGLQDDVRMIFGAGEQDPPGLQQVPLDGIVVMIAAFSLMWHTVIDLWQPLPIWQVALLWIGGTLIIAADPVSYTAGRTRRY